MVLIVVLIQQLDKARVLIILCCFEALISARTAWSMRGMITFWAYSLYFGMLAIMFEMIKPLRFAWYFKAYSMASSPPQDWP